LLQLRHDKFFGKTVSEKASNDNFALLSHITKLVKRCDLRVSCFARPCRSTS